MNFNNNIKEECLQWKREGKSIVFTNGCFDLLHKGHKDLLIKASSFGNLLIVGLNSDISVRSLKGKDRPIQSEKIRKNILIRLGIVSREYIFSERTPLNLIRLIKPDVLVKGGDYKIDQIVGSKDVMLNGGKVKIVPITPGFSTTSQIKKIKRQ